MGKARIYTDDRGRRYAQAYGKKDPVSGKAYKPSKTIPKNATDAEIEAICDHVELLAGLSKKTGFSATVGGLVHFYLDLLSKKKEFSHKTLETYFSLSRCHVQPLLGKINYTDASEEDFFDLYRLMLSNGLSQRTVKLLHSMLSGCFRALAEEGVVEHNIIAGMRVSKGEGVEAKALSEHDFGLLRDRLVESLSRPDEELINDFDDYSRAAAIWLDAHTGFRKSELGGFRVASFKPAMHSIRVSEKLVSVTGVGLVYGKPKSKKSRRTLELDADTVEVLRRYIRIQAEVLAKHGITQHSKTPLFSRPNGAPRNPDEFYDHFVSLRDTLHLEKDLKLHSLRHTHATYLIENGFSARMVMERLGHHDISMTLGTYGHLFPGADAEAADGFASISASLGSKSLRTFETGVISCPYCGRVLPESVCMQAASTDTNQSIINEESSQVNDPVEDL